MKIPGFRKSWSRESLRRNSISEGIWNPNRERLRTLSNAHSHFSSPDTRRKFPRTPSNDNLPASALPAASREGFMGTVPLRGSLLPLKIAADKEEEEKNARRRSFYNHIGFSVGLVVLSVAVLCCVDVKYLPFVLIATVMTLFVIGWRFSLKFANAAVPTEKAKGSKSGNSNTDEIISASTPIPNKGPILTSPPSVSGGKADVLVGTSTPRLNLPKGHSRSLSSSPSELRQFAQATEGDDGEFHTVSRGEFEGPEVGSGSDSDSETSSAYSSNAISPNTVSMDGDYTDSGNSHVYRIKVGVDAGDGAWGYLRATEKGHFELASQGSMKPDSAAFMYLIHRKTICRSELYVNVIGVQSLLTKQFMSRAHFSKEVTAAPHFKPHETINATIPLWRVYRNGYKDPVPFYFNGKSLCVGQKGIKPASFQLVEVPEEQLTPALRDDRNKFLKKREKKRVRKEEKKSMKKLQRVKTAIHMDK